MLSLVGTLIGLLGSFIPKFLDYLRAKEDHRHEIAILQLKASIAKQEHIYRLEEVEAQADATSEQAVYKQAELKYTGVRWIDGLMALYAGTIRPTITYLFMFAYIVVKYAQYRVAVTYNTDPWQIVIQLWNSEDMAAFMCILGFWFGGRLLKHNLAAFGIGDNNGGGSKPDSKVTTSVEVSTDKLPVDKPDKRPRPGEIFSTTPSETIHGF